MATSSARGPTAMLDIHFFASVREAMQEDRLQLEQPAEVTTVAGLIDYLEETRPRFAALNSSTNPLLVAVNQSVVARDAPLSDGDEVAFFPPMTGG